MKRIFIVFTNVSARTGEGTNFDVNDAEKERLDKVVNRIKTLVPELGNTLATAEYPNLAMVSARLLSLHPEINCNFRVFVGLHGFLENAQPGEVCERYDTLIVSCLSFYPERRSLDDRLFYDLFTKWWNESCAVFGMPRIPSHDHGGDGALLYIDHVDRIVRWIDVETRPLVAENWFDQQIIDNL